MEERCTCDYEERRCDWCKSLESRLAELQAGINGYIADVHSAKRALRVAIEAQGEQFKLREAAESRLAAAEDGLKDWDSACWQCAHLDIAGDPEVHEHEPNGQHWHHYIEGGPGPCKNSDMLNRVTDEMQKRIAELEQENKRLREAAGILDTLR